MGYIFFRNFVEPSFEAIDTAFATLGADGSTILSSTFAITGEASLTLRSTWPATSAVYGRRVRSSASISTTTSKPRSTGFSASRKSLQWRRSTG